MQITLDFIEPLLHVYGYQSVVTRTAKAKTVCLFSFLSVAFICWYDNSICSHDGAVSEARSVGFEQFRMHNKLEEASFFLIWYLR